MSDKVVYWWHTYGPFEAGEDGLPHLGQVIKHYRELRGWSKEEAALVLDCTVRYLEMLESAKNTKMPESLPRRAFIARNLGIPLVLMGILPLVDNERNTFPDTLLTLTENFSVVSPQTMSMYERMLSFCWEACYTSSFQRASDDVAFCLSLLNEAAKNTAGIQRSQINMMRCKFYQLSGIIARDRLDFTRALEDGTKAVDLALELNNAELISSALEHRSGTYARTKQYETALVDIQRALPYADRSRSILKGNVYLVAAEKYTRVQGQQAESIVMKQLDTVGSIVRKGPLEDDGSFLKLNISSLYIERAKVLSCFGKFDDAHNSFKIAHKHLSPDLISWQANILLEEAETDLKENEIEGCCERALKAIKIVRNLRSRSREQRIQQLYQQCKKIAPNNALVCHLGEMLSDKRS